MDFITGQGSSHISSQLINISTFSSIEHRKMSFSREMANFFFSKGETTGVGAREKSFYSCRREALTGQKCSSMKNSFSVLTTAGFQNLKTHLRDCVPNYVTLYEDRDIVNKADIRFFVCVDKKSQNLFRWIEWVVCSNLPFSFVDNELTRVNTQSTRKAILWPH